MASRKTLSDLQVAKRREQLIAMRRDGHSWSEIAQALDYFDAAAACQDLRRALEHHQKQLALTLDEQRQIELEKLDRLERAALAVLNRPHVHVSGGKVVRDTELDDEGNEVAGQPLLDDGPSLQAIETLRRLAERRARLLGIDAPTRVEAEGTLEVRVVGVDVEDLT